ncbi:MAG: hypothetical protein ACPGXX_04060, partial [Planctomycetaceae bacterium]
LMPLAIAVKEMQPYLPTQLRSHRSRQNETTVRTLNSANHGLRLSRRPMPENGNDIITGIAAVQPINYNNQEALS